MSLTFRRVWDRWKEIAGYIGDFQARLLLTIFYFTILVPFGLVSRLISDPLDIKYVPEESAWLSRRSGDKKLSDTYRQY